MQRRSLPLAGALALFMALGPLTACQPPGPPPAIPPMGPQSQEVAGLPVCQVAGETLLGDLVRPGQAQHRRRAVLFIHGGGWQAGTRQEYLPLVRSLAQAGYTGVTVDYRLSPAVRHPDHLADVKCAIRWLRQHAAALDVDPDRIALVGGSAGAHLATLAAYTPDDPAYEGRGQPQTGSTRVAAVVGHSGPYDLRGAADFRADARGAVTAFLGRVPFRDADLAAASPVSFVRRDSTPTLLIHGELDPVVPADQARRLAAALQAAGATHELLLIPGAGHADFGDRPDEVGRRLFQFLETHLR